MTIRRYFWTVAISWYDPRSGCKRELETHYTAARSGVIRDNRRKLGRRGAKYHQLILLIRYGKFVPLRNIKVRFEREKPARKIDRKISVEARSMQFRGKHWTATPLPSAQIPFWASKDERIFDSMRKMAESREAHRKEIRALMEKLMKNAK
jgi:hypothetical protein